LDGHLFVKSARLRNNMTRPLAGTLFEAHAGGAL
jgi:hypothetical protein